VVSLDVVTEDELEVMDDAGYVIGISFEYNMNSNKSYRSGGYDS